MTEQWQELKEIITVMRDNGGTGTQQEVCMFLANLIDELENEIQKPKWIPVSERLPEDKQGCIVTVQGDSKTFIDIVTYYAEEHSFLYYEECNVLAWMPLPEPYKPESEGAE